MKASKSDCPEACILTPGCFALTLASQRSGPIAPNMFYMLQNREEVERLISIQDVTCFMQPLRGFPAYWDKALRDVRAIVRQLGMPTFFLTFSTADIRWPEVVEVIKAQRHMSCQMPDPKTDPELHKIVSEVQIHSRNHAKTCTKANMECRFRLPKIPMDLCTYHSAPYRGEF